MAGIRTLQLAIGGLIDAHLRRNPHFGCVRIAQQITRAFGVAIDEDVVRRVLAGLTPAQCAGELCPAPAALDQYGWQQHCQGLFELPIAA